MEQIGWVLTLGMDTIKMALFLFGVLGFEVKKGKGKYVSFLYLFLGIPMILQFSVETFWYTNIWKILFIVAFVKETTGKRIQCFFLQLIAITLGDLTIVGICNFMPHNLIEATAKKEVCEAIALVIWLFIVILMKPYRKRIQNYIKTLSSGYIIIMIAELFCMVIIASCIYGIMINEMTEKIQRKALIFCVMAVIFNMLFCFLFTCVSYKQNRMKLENDMVQKQMELQKKYYDKMIHQDEGMRKFRHDIKNILQGLEILKNNNDIDGMKEYIDEVCGAFRENITLQTGNAIADYFINGVLEEVEKLDFKIIGNFPEKMKMSDSDWCILIANAMDNAKEALLQTKNERKLYIEVRQIEQGIWFNISNSAIEKQNQLLETKKKNKKDHGYGTENMKYIIEKYDGKIEFFYEQGMFCVEVYLM